MKDAGIGTWIGSIVGSVGRFVRNMADSVKTVTLEQMGRGMAAARETASGRVVGPESALSTPAGYACVRLISGVVKNMPISVMRKSGRQRLPQDSHPVHILLTRRPNRWMTPSALKQLMVSWALLRGNGCCQIVRGDKRRPVALIPLFPERLQFQQLPDNSIAYIYTRRDGTDVVLPMEDVFHFMPFTLNGFSGVTPITYARETIGLALTAEQHGASVFRNGTHVGGLFKHKGELSAAAYDRLKEQMAQYRGAAKAGENLILEEDMTFERLGMTAEDAQYIETRKLSRSDIAMFFGVPPHMIGDTDASTSWGTGIESMSQGFQTYTAEDYLTAFEEAADARLLDGQADLYTRFNRAALVRGNLEARSNHYVRMLQWGVVSPNEVRALEDLNPRDGGDTYYLPPNTAGNATGAQI